MYHFYGRFSFVIGILLGILAALLLKPKMQVQRTGSFKGPPDGYEEWFIGKSMQRLNLSLDYIRYGHHDHLLESDFLYKEVKINCVILVREHKNLQGARDTWAKGCNKVTAVELASKNKRMPMKRNPEDSTWVSLCRALMQAPMDFDWVMVVNDPTFVVMENLRYYVAPMNQSDGIYMGHPVNFWSVDYNSGKSGYVLSSGALQQLKESLGESCDAEASFLNREDFYLGKLLRGLNITPKDTRDSEGFSRFHLYSWMQELFPGMNYYKTSVYPNKCCSSHSITFQAIEGDHMYKYYYFLYTLQLFNRGHLGSKPAEQPKEKVWKTFLQQQNISHNVSADEYYRIWEDVVQNPSIFGQRFRPDLSD